MKKCFARNGVSIWNSIPYSVESDEPFIRVDQRIVVEDGIYIGKEELRD